MNWILKLKQFVKKFTSRKVSDKVEIIANLPDREKINCAPVIQSGYVLLKGAHLSGAYTSEGSGEEHEDDFLAPEMGTAATVLVLIE